MTKTVSDLIDLWPDPKIANFGRDIGTTVEHAATIKRRNSIPVQYWPDVVAGAKARKIVGINYDSLVSAHVAKSGLAA